MAKYLDYDGLSTLWGKIKERDDNVLEAAQNYADSAAGEVAEDVTTLQGYFNGDGAALEAVKASQDGNGAVIASTYVKVSTKGQANGVCPLDANAKVAAAYLPGYVDDIVEGYYHQSKFYTTSAHSTEIAGEAGKVYVDLSTNKTYRWSGTAYVEISASLAIGTTAGTAYDGASGAALASSVAGILAAYIKSAAVSGKTLTLTTEDDETVTFTDTDTGATALSGNTAETGKAFTAASYNATTRTITFTKGSFLTAHAYRPINVKGTEKLGTSSATALNFAEGSNITLTYSNGTLTIASTDTDTGATSLEVTGTGNAITTASYDATTRKITFTKGSTFLTSHQSIKTLKTDNTTAQTASSSESITGSGTINLHKVSKTGNYNDLLNKPTIPAVEAITAQELEALLV